MGFLNKYLFMRAKILIFNISYEYSETKQAGKSADLSKYRSL